MYVCTYKGESACECVNRVDLNVEDNKQQQLYESPRVCIPQLMNDCGIWPLSSFESNGDSSGFVFVYQKLLLIEVIHA